MATKRAVRPRSEARMVHVRLDPELHRRLRMIVAADDTTVQDWLAQIVTDAVQNAWPSIARSDVGQ